jgi:hypothetical protein
LFFKLRAFIRQFIICFLTNCFICMKLVRFLTFICYAITFLTKKIKIFVSCLFCLLFCLLFHLLFCLLFHLLFCLLFHLLLYKRCFKGDGKIWGNFGLKPKISPYFPQFSHPIFPQIIFTNLLTILSDSPSNPPLSSTILPLPLPYICPELNM